ncbi:putative RNA-binding protein (virulence factor B family) [Aquimarina sp. EL_43]|uniref:CvfB family protein n=1 Tax=Aquimarina TaxID=290174 RepID=UPI00046F32C4|nr:MULTISPECIES: S1-like domain-containing RNA-binding protein [Aquimarina]MBG6129806.1 putative RNA-binding protein (virulence factor B family) [Aquimarina sp. EL_35]MBG6150871.1 putative RNA-binding protein (virulence factor B family) [Aquimarina sp. EL_32]MBG6167822.1 putative RNA-binding protein (virulence factor B family) [Aquimarina sp. EL_43]
MLKLGEYNMLEIVREREQGIYLCDEEGDEVLLPNKYVPEQFQIRDVLKVFVYLDSSERIVATTLEPFATVKSFAYLKCTNVSGIGAFLDWGLEKDLFVPFREQSSKMRVGSWYLVYVYLDEETNRLVASSKTNAFLDNSLVLLSSYDEVDLIASHPSPQGWNMIVNQKHLGLVYSDEIFQKITPGDQLKGFVKKVRPDGKIDLTLQRHGFRGIEPNAEQILKELKLSGGFIDLNDKSDPEDIKEVFQLSKKSFKKAIGSLYKLRKIVIEKEGIRLVE